VGLTRRHEVAKKLTHVQCLIPILSIVQNLKPAALLCQSMKVLLRQE
jgi:hypothetical protein